MSFYISLPSNNNSKFFYNNTTSDFTTQLQAPLKLNTNYKVGLVELIYNQSWNVNLGELEILDTLNDNEFKSIVTIDILDGSSVFSLINKINFEINKHCIMHEYHRRRSLAMKQNGNSKDEYFKLKLDENNEILVSLEQNPPNKKVLSDIEKTIGMSPKLFFINHKVNFNLRKNLKLKFSDKLQMILHLNKKYFTENDLQSTEIIYNDYLKVVNTFYVYTDIIKYQFVGETFSPLLRNVVVNTDYLKPCSVIFENPHYVELNKTEISTINISIRDEFGENIKFLEGSVIVKLHFKLHDD